MSFIKWVRGLFTSPVIVTGEAIHFQVEENTRTGESVLNVSIRSSKEIISVLEATLKNKTYSILADEANNKQFALMDTYPSIEKPKAQVRIVN